MLSGRSMLTGSSRLFFVEQLPEIPCEPGPDFYGEPWSGWDIPKHFLGLAWDIPKISWDQIWDQFGISSCKSFRFWDSPFLWMLDVKRREATAEGDGATQGWAFRTHRGVTQPAASVARAGQPHATHRSRPQVLRHFCNHAREAFSPNWRSILRSVKCSKSQRICRWECCRDSLRSRRREHVWRWAV